MDAGQHTQSYTPPDGASILELINPSREVEALMLSFLGLEHQTKVISGKSTRKTVRNNKPTFTDEFVRSLMKDIQQFVNFTTQVSRYDDIRIKRHVGSYFLALAKSLATQGDDHFISDRTWSRILEIYHTKYTEQDEKGEEKEYNGWKRFGIEWEYDQPVRFEMLQFGIKDFDEEVDQTVDFKRLIRALAPFLEGSLNKSFSGNHDGTGMLLRALGEIRTESQTFSSGKDKKRGKLFGRSEQESESWS